MLYLFGILIVLSVSCSTTLSHPSDSEHKITAKYVIKIDPHNSESVDNETCLPSPNKPSTVPCNSLNYTFQQIDKFNDSVMFLLVSPKSPYPLSTVATFQNINYGISIVGNASVIQCDTSTSAGLTFLHSSNIEIHNISFVGCGALQNSTSRDYTQPAMQMLMIKVGLYFYNCSNVDLYRVEVVSSQATGVVMYDTNGLVQVTSCLFYNNTADIGVPGGGGFAVEFTYCSPGDTACPNNYTVYDPGYRNTNIAAEYMFTNCLFDSNVARSQNYTSSAGNLIFASLANHTGVGRGGGLSVYFKGVARNKLVNITNCHFINNSAVWGGGVLVEMDDNTINNSVLISGCNFTGNHAFYHEDFGTGGGGLRIATTVYFWDQTYQISNYTRNEITVERSNFTKNKAIQGGAISFSVARQRWSYFSQVTHLIVSDCTFDSNRAQLGAAVTVTLYPIFSEGFVPPLIFHSCYFLSNHVVNHLYEKNQNDSLKSHPSGMGAVYVNEVPAAFSISANFSDNHGSALAVVGAQIDFSGTHALFYNNSGSSGGALALLGASSILTGPQTTMIFTENSASIHGGAIYNRYISKEDLKSSVNCFFRYSDPFVGPFNWSAQFNFSQNFAKKLGHSIYSTAALPCLWARPSASESFKSEYVFCSEQWHFSNSNCTEQVYTEARRISLRSNTPSQIEAFPGRGFVLPLDAFDDFKHNVTNDTVYAADIQSSNAEVDPSFAYVAHNYIAITGKPGTTVNMSMYTAGSHTTYIKLNLTILMCPPGFQYTSSFENDSISETDHLRSIDSYFNYEGELDKYTSCKCPPNATYRGNLRCLEHEFHSQIHSRYWIGVPKNDTNNSELLMGLVPQYYTTSTPYGNEYIDIPRNHSLSNDVICGGGNRNGTLCGSCLEGYGVAINSKIYKCVSCNMSTPKKVGYTFAYIALTYVPILCLFFAIIIFNFKLTSSAALSFVLFAQMIGSGVFSLTAGEAVYLNNTHVNLMEKAYTTVYGFFNLNSLAFLMDPFCISESLTTLHVLTLEYVIAAFPIAMIAIIYLAYRCSALKCGCYDRRRNRRLRGADPSSTTTIQSTSSLRESEKRGPRNTLIHAFVAFLFLSYTKFSLASMFTMSITELFDENGTSRGADYIYLAGDLRFSEHGYLLPYGILAILILIFIVILPPLLLLGPIQFIDWLIDKRGFNRLQRVWPSITIHTFLDTFQGFYKPNRRFFSGIYFLFRLAVFLNFSFCKTIMEQYIFQQVAVMVLIVLVALFRPYTRDFYNYLDVLILFNLGLLNALAIYIFTSKFSSFPYNVYIVECILVWLPLIYMICYAIWNRVHKTKLYNVVGRIVSPTRFLQEDGTNEEREQLLGGNPANRSLEDSVNFHGTNSEDPDETLFRRASRRNRYTGSAQKRPPAGSGTGNVTVSTTVVSVWEESEKDLVKRDSGTSTGGSSRSGPDSNDS